MVGTLCLYLLTHNTGQKLTVQDLWRTANRVLRPSEGISQLNYGLGSGVPTIVAQGPDLTRLGDVKRALRRWDLGRAE
jgi:processing peptidase subunit alpha